MRISDGSSDVCSSDLKPGARATSPPPLCPKRADRRGKRGRSSRTVPAAPLPRESGLAAPPTLHSSRPESPPPTTAGHLVTPAAQAPASRPASASCRCESSAAIHPDSRRSEEHTSELQSLMRISYAVFCLKKKKHTKSTIN